MATQFDYIVVGAGPAGCVIAARLSEDPANRVLLVEAGGRARGPVTAMPAALPFAYQRRAIQWGYTSGPEPHLNGRTIDEKAGKAVGGSSAINAMIYNRGNPMDYDGWARLGLPEWSYAHCLPYFRRMETFAGGPDQWRGGDGPLRISRCRAAHKLHDAFLHPASRPGSASRRTTTATGRRACTSPRPSFTTACAGTPPAPTCDRRSGGRTCPC